MLQKDNIKYIMGLSPLQEGMFFHHALNPGSLQYFTQTAFHFKGEIDREMFRRSFQAIIDRYDTLRSVFIQKDVMPPRQIVLKQQPALFQYVQADTLLTSAEKEIFTQSHLEEDRERLFDLSKGNLMRLSLAKTGEQEYHLIWSHHHILMDGWCLAVIISEFFNIYKGLLGNTPVVLPPAVPYLNYIKWLDKVDRHASMHYWKQYLEGYETPAMLPGATGATGTGLASAEVELELPEDVTAQLVELSRLHNVTLNVVMQCIWGILLGKYNQCTDVVFGAIVSGRPPEIEGIERVVGLFINTIPVRINAAEAGSFARLLALVQQQVIESAAHHYVQLAEVQRQSGPGRELINHIMVFENYPVSEKAREEADSLHLKITGGGGFEQSNYPFNVLVYPGERLRIRFTFDPGQYEAAAVYAIRNHYYTLVQSVLIGSDQRVGELAYLGREEQQELLGWSHARQEEQPRPVSLLAALAEQALGQPQATALVCGPHRLTYRQLHEQSDQLAQYLREHHGVGAGQLVGLLAERGPLAVVSLLAILKAGAAYLPLDPAHPAERIVDILEQAGPHLLLTDQALAHCPVATLSLEEQPWLEQPRPAKPLALPQEEQLAYVLYTSGSTGRPKGVQVSHANLNHLLAAASQLCPCRGPVVFPCIASLTFDISLFQLLMPLLTGGTCLLVAPQVLEDMDQLSAVLQQSTVIDTVPAVYNLLLDHVEAQGQQALFAHVEHLFVGGDAVADPLLLRLAATFPQARITVTYGPTEGTIMCAYRAYAPGTISTTSRGAHLGGPLAGSRLYVLDPQGGLVAKGVTGEICIGGPGVALGYLHEPDLTRDKFGEDPYQAGGRLYRTGDLGRWLPDGTLVFAGRRDGQVKVRGQRIEVAEVEQALARCPGVGQAVVKAWPQGQDKYLAAYLMGESGQRLETASLRAALGRQLPAYMLPARFLQVEQLPLTANGKVDRQALPDPAGVVGEDEPAAAPRTDLEGKLVEIWQEVLGKKGIGIHDNFFDTGGHSIKAIQLVSRIKKYLEGNIRLPEIFEHPTVAAQAAFLSGSGKALGSGILPAPASHQYPLSHAQRMFWLLSQLSERSVAYNVPNVLLLEGAVHPENLFQAVRYVVGRHESLRTVFTEDAEGEVWQHILLEPDKAFSFRFEEEAPATSQQRLKDIYSEEQNLLFSLTHGPLLRVRLVRVNDQRHALCYTMHHIINDGWSMEVLASEVQAAYNVICRGGEPNLPPLPVQYKDYAVWQASQQRQPAFAQAEQYWLGQLGGALPVLDLPADKRRPAVKTHRGKTIEQLFPPDVQRDLKRCASAEGCTLYVVLLSALKAVFYRYTGQEDIIVGSPIAGRTHKELEGQIGVFINSLALRTRFSGKESFRSLLGKVKAMLLDAYAHQEYPFDLLVERLQVDKNLSRLPLFDVMVGMHAQAMANDPQAGNGFEGLQTREMDGIERETSQFDLLFSFVEMREGLRLSLTYNPDVYSERNVTDLTGHFARLLAAVVRNPLVSLHRIDYLSEQEKQQLAGFNDTAVAGDDQATLVEVFERQAALTPRRAAVRFEDKELTYDELNEQANRLAHHLRSAYAVEPGDRVALMAERSEYQIVALLGILKAGAAYVPINPGNPASRIGYMLAEAQPVVVLAESEYIFGLLEEYDGEMFALDIELDGLSPVLENPVWRATATDLAYVIYTSGSTGRPKGVMVEHGGVVNMAFDQIRKFGVRDSDRVLLFADVSFDAAVSELCMAFFTGATAVVVGESVIRQKNRFLAYLTGQGVTVATLPPAFLQVFEKGSFSFLRVLITAGQEANTDQANEYSQQLNYFNAYGPTENSVCTTLYKVAPQPGTRSIPIGKPIANNRVYVLDAHLQLLPVGVPGDMYVSGAGLARGYLNNPELTAEKFIPNPHEPGNKMYATGDQGCWRADGNLEFLGRNDFQVKIRGHRVETAEIEQVILRYPGILEVVVLARAEKEGHGLVLVAYLVADAPFDAAGLKEHLANDLPEYMVPVHFVPMEAIPLTANGKTDREALPDPVANPEQALAFVAPATALEAALVKMWEEVLGRANIGTTTNFFALGGQSLKSMQLLSRIRKGLRVQIELHQLFVLTTVQEQARYITTARAEELNAIPVVADAESYPLSHAQRRFWVLSQFPEGSLAFNIPAAFLLEGTLNRDALAGTVAFLVGRHESLRTVFREDASGIVRQWVLPPGAHGDLFRYADLSGENDPAAALQQLFLGEQAIPFDLVHGPLLRVRLLKLREDVHALLYTMHHIISDGWSMEVLSGEITRVYNALSRVEAPGLPALGIQYRDYASWQLAQSVGAAWEQHEQYWLEQLGGTLPVLELADKTRLPVKTHRGSTTAITIPVESTQALRALCRESETSLFAGLLASLNALFYLYTGQEDIIMGTPIASRDHPDLENQIGLYLNTLALRTRFEGTDNFVDLLGRVKEVLLGAYRHQAYPFDQLIGTLKPEYNRSRHPLFDVLVILQNQTNTRIGAGTGDFQDCVMRSWSGASRVTSQFDLEFSFTEQGDEVRLEVTYNTDVFTRQRVEQLCLHLCNVLGQGAADPAQRISRIAYLLPEETHQLLHQFNNTAGLRPADMSLVPIFERQAARTPDQIAVVYEQRHLTYRELNEKANRLAHYLRDGCGVKSNELVGLMLGRSEQLLVGILGIWKAGAAYVPLDPTYPKDRIAFILQDSKAAVVLGSKALPPDLPFDGRVLLLEEALAVSDHPADLPLQYAAGDLCYVIYTSGSLGQPKGVMISHGNAANFFMAMDQALPVSEDDCLLALTSTSFDISVLELCWTVCRGVQVVIHPSDMETGGLDRYLSEEDTSMDFSLFFFSSYTNQADNKYDLLLDAAKYADAHGYQAIWTPERHFHEFGGLYPNPSVISAALAMVTRNLSLRSGSVVAPLHDVLRIAEEWSVVDNLSGGRVGLSLASGWNPNDFVLSNVAYSERQKVMYGQVETLRQLWRGNAVKRTNALGAEVELRVFPQPVQPELPLWITTAGSEETFVSAGALGANVLTHFLGQDIAELAVKIRAYREARKRHGFAGAGKVTLMLHTYLADDIQEVEQLVEQPLIDYLKSSVGLSKILLREAGLTEEHLSVDMQNTILKNTFKRYYTTSALIGTRQSCSAMVQRLKAIGVDEIACLIDFGLDPGKVMEGLEQLTALKQLFTARGQRVHKPVTLMQSTPSFLRMAEEDAQSQKFLGSLRRLLAGGEALPLSLLRNLSQKYPAQVYNMYGPTETTVWSCVERLDKEASRVSIGKPILNTWVYILSQDLQLLPVGVAGDLYIGGSGVSPGYWNNPPLTAERFIADPFRPGERMYHTGDVARWLPGGSLEYIGRKDQQVKIRGYRIELEEIERVLLTHDQVREAVVVAREGKDGREQYLAAYLVTSGELSAEQLRTHAGKRLPEYMIPALFVLLPQLPLTPNGKIDRKSLPDPTAAGLPSRAYTAPGNETERRLVEVWEEVLDRRPVGMDDNFFEIGGESLSGMRLINRIKNEWKVNIDIADLFGAQTVRELGTLLTDLNKVGTCQEKTNHYTESEEIIL